MNGDKLFLDTNIILYLLNGDQTLAELIHNKQLYISVITELELLGYNGLQKEEENTIIEFVTECKIINLNEEIKQKHHPISKSLSFQTTRQYHYGDGFLP